MQKECRTSSSAVAKRPRDASCLSVVSFNSTKRRTESFIVSYVCYRFITACNYMLFCCLWRNIETSCHKHFAVLSRHQQTLPHTTSECHNLQDGGPTASYWQHLAGSSVNSTQWNQILAQNRDFCLPHLHSTPPLAGFPSEYYYTVWCRKTRMEWLSGGENVLKICLFVLTECTNVTDTRTDRQTDR